MSAIMLLQCFAVDSLALTFPPPIYEPIRPTLTSTFLLYYCQPRGRNVSHGLAQTIS